MKKAFKLFLASLLTVSLGLATVICCCIAPSVMAHFHKTVTCNHCPNQDSNGKSSNPAVACLQQLTSAELFQGQSVSLAVDLSKHLSTINIFAKHMTALPPPSLLAYPPGSPLIGTSFTPLYLRTFNLRI